MAIQKVTLADGKIVYDVYVQDPDVHGRRVQKRKRALPSLKAARDAEALLRAELLLAKGRPARLSWGMWLGECIKQMQVTHRPSTVINYEKSLGKWVTPIFKDQFLDEITSIEIHRLIYEQMVDVSPGTRRQTLDMIRRIFTMAMHNGIVAKNPATVVKVKVPQPKQTVLNGTEAQKLLLEAKLLEHRFYPIWAAALFTGMRSGELYALRWGDVDLENGRIYVSRSWCSKNGFGPTKNQKNRVVPISTSLRKLLAELALKRGKESTSEDFVLPHPRAWTLGEQAKVLREFCRGIGITAIRFHDLRATFITQLLLKGVSLAQVMAMVGHSELKTTNGYLRVAGSDLNGATEMLSYSLPQEELAEVLELKPRNSAAVL